MVCLNYCNKLIYSKLIDISCHYIFTESFDIFGMFRVTMVSEPFNVIL